MAQDDTDFAGETHLGTFANLSVPPLDGGEYTYQVKIEDGYGRQAVDTGSFWCNDGDEAGQGGSRVNDDYVR